VQKCSFSGSFLGHDQIETSQETPFVVASSNIDYLRFGNVKFSDKSLALRDQETSKTNCNLGGLNIIFNKVN